MGINLKVHVIFSLFCSMVVLKPLLCCRSATYIFPCPLTLSLNLSLYSLFLIMPFISALFDTQLKMGGQFVCKEQLHSFYFYSFDSFSFWVFALCEYCLERDLWQGLWPCECNTYLKSWYFFPSPAVCGNIFCGLQVCSFRLHNIKCSCYLLINAKMFYCVSAEWACSHFTSK